MENTVPLRRRPEQARSRARVDMILTAAAELIGEQGVDPPSMTDIAERAGMGVTALYRYFPNKQSVLRELSLEMLELNRQLFVATTTETAGSFDDAAHSSIRAYWRLHRDEPFRLRLRVAIHGDAELSALDLNDSRRNARLLAARAAEMDARIDTDEIEDRVFLIISLLDSLMLTAIQLDPPDAEKMINQFSAMAVATLMPEG